MLLNSAARAVMATVVYISLHTPTPNERDDLEYFTRCETCVAIRARNIVETRAFRPIAVLSHSESCLPRASRLAVGKE